MKRQKYNFSIHCDITKIYLFIIDNNSTVTITQKSKHLVVFSFFHIRCFMNVLILNKPWNNTINTAHDPDTIFGSSYIVLIKTFCTYHLHGYEHSLLCASIPYYKSNILLIRDGVITCGLLPSWIYDVMIPPIRE